jgi:hypothetical protein
VRWCYGGRRWSYGGEEGEEGELELHGRRTASGGGRATLTVEKLATAEAATAATARLGQRCVAPSDRGTRTRLVRAAAAHARQRSAERASAALSEEARSAGRGWDARRAVPTALKAALSVWRVADTRQRHAAARARRGARRLTSGTHLSAISELKITPKKLAQNK